MQSDECGETTTTRATIEEVARRFERGEELSVLELSRLCRDRDKVALEHRTRLDQECCDYGMTEKRKDIGSMTDEERREYFRSLRKKRKK